ncbi:aminoacyl-tRNA hydrolase [Hydrocarboniclastica marina]|uniref:Peptidyl-tRNA hydrolase n=1 Tax=Hydrocarboniclastica marina TaxID=2259620 RepID=A0A4P7XF85_9ALTE|nr:aminoacyl-tRNA hydrolase [Hydrocarboniclastica marina]QCF25233.1 aminoacyl-tRNA hydrolase [Hydrocarboniclastica marina]
MPENAKQDIQLVVGLGNPGPEYAQTRHNAGALFVEALARAAGQSLRPERKYLGLYCRINWQGADLHLLIPTTYMNRSGQSVKALADFFKLQPQQILVAHDELDLEPGSVKLKRGGGHGGHNGLRDLISHLGTNDFHRLRLGIGHPGDRSAVVNYVLGKLGKPEAEALSAAMEASSDELAEATRGDWNKAMNRLNGFRPSQP